MVIRVLLNFSHINLLGFSKLAILKNKAKNRKGPTTSHRKTDAKLWLVSFGNGMFCLDYQTFVVEGLGGRLHLFETTYRMVTLSCPFLQCFGKWITVKFHYIALQRQLSQGCTIFIDSYYIICKNYVWLCGNLRIMRSDAIIVQL